MKKFLSLILVVFMVAAMFTVFTACENNKEEESSSEDTTMKEEETSTVGETVSETESVSETDEETTVGETTEETTTNVLSNLDVKAEDLNDMMQSIFKGNEVKNETLFFIDKGDEKQLLFPATEIISVTSYDGKTTYENGKDYVLVDGKVKVTENSSIPCITSNEYYKATANDMLHVKVDGKNTSVYWGEGNTMTKWQVNVTYKHDAVWEGYEQKCNALTYENVLNKLIAGEDVTFIFYGDSITCGANSSWYVGVEPSQHSYSMLFTEAVADLFDYTVNYVDVSELHALIKKTPENYVAGTRGVINYINPSVGGWTSTDGKNNFANFVKPYIEEYGCDLFTVAFGMNDGGTAQNTFQNNIKEIIKNVTKLDKDASIVLMATMVPNPLATDGWYGNQKDQQATLDKLAKSLSSAGTHTAVAGMTKMSLSILEHKEFLDYTGNNINHPNDFFGRVYAQTLLQCFIGYENLK